jgi:broad specificity phosphatase PhoE
MTRLLLIRHGETDYNLNRRYCGFSNPSLNIFGISQAENLTRELKDFGVTAVYSSDLLRATQTAEILFPKHQIKTIPDFREYNFGVFEGLTYDEIIKNHPKLYRDWINNHSSVMLPGGEGFEEFKKRVCSALSSTISLNKDKTIALVTHSGPIRLILCKALGCGFEKFWKASQGNATFSVIGYSDDCVAETIKVNESLCSLVGVGRT